MANARAVVDRLLHTLNRFARLTHHQANYAGDEVPAPSPDRLAYLHRACALLKVNQDRARFAGTLQQLAAQTVGCTVPVALSQIESKIFLAWLSDPATRPENLSPEETAAVSTLLPWTRLLTRLQGAELERVQQSRDDFILKKTDSYQALDVFFGCNMPEHEWLALLQAKLGQPDVQGGTPNFWIVQERVRPKVYQLPEYTDAGLIERRTGLSCCPYILGGKIRALETWIMPFVPAMDMINKMHFVPHFIQNA